MSHDIIELSQKPAVRCQWRNISDINFSSLVPSPPPPPSYYWVLQSVSHSLFRCGKLHWEYVQLEHQVSCFQFLYTQVDTRESKVEELSEQEISTMHITIWNYKTATISPASLQTGQHIEATSATCIDTASFVPKTLPARISECCLVSSPDLIRHVYRFQYNRARYWKQSTLGLVLGLGPRLSAV